MDSLINFFVDLFKDKIPAELTIFITSMLPLIELRGGLIVAWLLKVDFVKAFAICFFANIIPIPFILIFIKKIFAIMRKISPNGLGKIVDWLEKKREKGRDKIEKYGVWGLLIFVAIPLPGTGGWTGALIAALLDMDIKKSFAVISIGVLIAGIIMSILTYFIPGLFGIQIS